jgi:hypothetical protein
MIREAEAGRCRPDLKFRTLFRVAPTSECCFSHKVHSRKLGGVVIK